MHADCSAPAAFLTRLGAVEVWDGPTLDEPRTTTTTGRLHRQRLPCGSSGGQPRDGDGHELNGRSDEPRRVHDRRRRDR